MVPASPRAAPPGAATARPGPAGRGLPLLVVLAMGAALAPSLPNLTVNWRESDVLMVGRNACRGVSSLAFPRIDHAGPEPRITGMELPLLGHLAARVACGGAGQVMAARLLTLALGALGVVCAWALARRHLGAAGTALATVGLAFSPVYLFYSRTIQPDVPSVALGMLALVLMDRALPPGAPTRWALYLGSAAALAAGALVKLPVVVYGLPLLVWLLERRGLAAARDGRSWLYAPLALLPPLLWYGHARRLQEEHGVRYFFLGHTWEQLAQAWLSPAFYWRIYGQLLFDAYACPALSALALGTLLVRWRRVPAWVRALAVASVVFFFLSGPSGAWHTSYGLVAVPAIAFAAGAGADALAARLPRGWHAPLLGLALVGVAGYGVWRVRGWAAPAGSIHAFEEARRRLDALAPPGEPLVVLSDGDPKLFWYLDRRGVIAPPQGLAAWMAAHRPAGARLLAVDVGRVRRAGQAHLQGELEALGWRPLWRSPQVELWRDDPG